MDVSVTAAREGPEAHSGAPRSAQRAIDRFVVLEELGAGGMGVIYTAWDPKLERRIALKLVRPDRESIEAHERLLREAQALARLAHPNVVSVFDVGSHEGSVWIAMEFVAGQTLRAWLEPKRRWPEILAMFRSAGAGLAAAHDAGLVHRDFKPENVLVGRDGRPRVADFGLVRPNDTSEASPTIEAEAAGPAVDPTIDAEGPTLAMRPPERTAPGSTGAWSRDLTHAGAMVGTPRYMAPEQFLSLPADARSDQFSFCVALYTALYEAPPFSGSKLVELIESVTRGEAQPPPRDSPVPASIGEALLRGLARDREERFPDMRALLDALEPPVPQTRRRVLGAAIALGLAAVALVASIAIPAAPADPCAAAPERAGEAWNAESRRAVRERFTARGDYAARSLPVIESTLDDWAERWSTIYEQTCRTRHEQSAERYDRRMDCLEDRLAMVEVLVGSLAEAEDELIRDAPDRTASLPDPAACSDAAALQPFVSPDPGKADEVAALRGELHRLQARVDVGDHRDLAEAIADLRARIEAADYLPLKAELALFEGGARRSPSADHTEIAALLRQAHHLALRAELDELAVKSANALIEEDRHVFPPDAKLLVSQRWADTSAALSARLGDPPALKIERRLALGRALLGEQRVDEALAELQPAVLLAEESFGPDDLRTARVLTEIGATLATSGRYREVEPLLEHALDIYEVTLGPEHPLLVRPLINRAWLMQEFGDYDRAIRDGQRALEILELTFGAKHPSTISALDVLAVTQDLRGDHRGAAEMLERLLERAGQSERLTDPARVSTANSLCFARYKEGRLDLARVACELALRGAEEHFVANHSGAAIIRNNFGLLARAEGDPEAGLAEDRRALEMVEASLGPDHPFVAYSLVGIGEGLLALGRADEAAHALERALAVRAANAEPGELGEAECLLGRALVERRRGTAQDRERGRELGRSGLSRLAAAGRNWRAQAEACRAWLGPA